MKITPERFYELAALLPADFHWGDALQAHHLEQILAAAKMQKSICSLSVGAHGYAFCTMPESKIHNLPHGEYNLFAERKEESKRTASGLNKPTA